jgi:hypothetical protein
MANDDFPGFIDDEPKPAKPAAPKPAVANPFAGQEVVVPGSAKALASAPAPAAPAAAAPKPAATAAKPTAAAKAAPAPSPAAPAVSNPFAGQTVGAPGSSDAEDPDLKPGSRKDLWKCPHCGTGNKPERTTCRSCEKSPSDPVAKPWFQNPLVLGGIAAGLAVAIGLWVMTRPDLSLKPAGAANVDGVARTGGGGDTVAIGDGLVFNGRTRIAVSGRIAHTSGANNATLVVLALKGSTDDAALTAATVVDGKVQGLTKQATYYLIFRPGTTPPALKAGDWLSVAGMSGTLSQGMMGVQGLSDGPVVLAEQFDVK